MRRRMMTMATHEITDDDDGDGDEGNVYFNLVANIFKAQTHNIELNKTCIY